MSRLACTLCSEWWRTKWTMAEVKKEVQVLRKQLAAERRAVAQANAVMAHAKVKAKYAAPVISGTGQKLVASAPAAYGSEMRSRFDFYKPGGKFKDALGIHGCEWVGPVIVPANAVTGQILRNDYVQPAEFSDSRLAMFGQMYEKFRFRRLRLRYVPAVGSNQAGSLLLAYDRDISDANPPPGSQGVRQCMSWADTVQGNAWLSHTLDAKLECPDSGYYTDEAVGGDERLCYQGQFYTMVVNPFGNSADLTIGNLVLDYELELFVPQLQVVIPTAHIDNTGATSATITDALRPYANTAAGVVKTAATIANMIPKFQEAGSVTNAIRLAEGVYRLVNNVNTFRAASVNTVFNDPVLTPLAPAPAPAPQCQVRKLHDSPGLAGAAGYCKWDGLVDVPKGGADLTMDFASFDTLSSTGGASLMLNKLGPYLPDLTSIF